MYSSCEFRLSILEFEFRISELKTLALGEELRTGSRKKTEILILEFGFLRLDS